LRRPLPQGNRLPWGRCAVLALALCGTGCRALAFAQDEPDPSGPYVVVLGTAQDGGYPQIGCRNPCCTDAIRDPSRARLVSSLLLVDPDTGSRWLFDATPDLPDQVAMAHTHGGDRGAGRPALFDGIFLTHAHLGHYTGLAYLGREAYGGQSLPVFGTPRMAAFLHRDAPWRLLVEGTHIKPVAIAPGETIVLSPGLSVESVLVPHREEITDTVAFVIRGPHRALLFLPDIDKWERWDRRIEDLIATVDLAFLDGTFFSGAELPHRDMAEIPHPFIVESLRRFSALPDSERAKIHFTHLNHSNPVVEPGSPEARQVRNAGMGVATEGAIHPL